MKGFKQDLNQLAKAVGAMQQRLDSSASDDQNRRTMGWLPQYVTGKIHDEGDGE